LRDDALAAVREDLDEVRRGLAVPPLGEPAALARGRDERPAEGLRRLRRPATRARERPLVPPASRRTRQNRRIAEPQIQLATAVLRQRAPRKLHPDERGRAGQEEYRARCHAPPPRERGRA